MDVPISVEKFKIQLHADEKLCPYPSMWDYFWQYINYQFQSSEEAPKCFILSGWWWTNNVDKGLQFGEQIDWCETNNILQDAYDFLSLLNEDNWLHTDEWNARNPNHKEEWHSVNGKKLKEHKIIIDMSIKKHEIKGR